MKDSISSKELLRRKLEKLDGWRTDLKCKLLPDIWREFVRKLCGRNTHTFFKNIVNPPKRFADSTSDAALACSAERHKTEHAEWTAQTDKCVDSLFERIDLLFEDAPIAVRSEVIESRGRFEAKQARESLREPVISWRPCDADELIPESVGRAFNVLTRILMAVLDSIELGLTEALSARSSTVATKTTRAVREHLRELKKAHGSLSREDLLKVANDDSKIKKLMPGTKLNINQLQNALSARNRQKDQKLRGGDQ